MSGELWVWAGPGAAGPLARVRAPFQRRLGGGARPPPRLATCSYSHRHFASFPDYDVSVLAFKSAADMERLKGQGVTPFK